MKFTILIILLLGAGWAYFQPFSFNISAGVALIILGVAVILKGLRGQHG